MVWIGKNRPELFELLFGAPRVRAVTVPLNSRLTTAELLGIVDDAGAALVVLGPDFAHLRPEIAGRTGVVVVGEDYDELLDGTPPTHAGAHPDARDDDTVLQLYTSGTTGRAKGVLVSHRQFGALRHAGGRWSLDAASVGERLSGRGRERDRRSPDVADVAVIGVPDATWGEAVKAVVAPAGGTTIDPDELVAWTKQRIAGFTRPRSVDVVDALPRNPSGEVLKKDLRAPDRDETEDGRPSG